MIKRSFIRSLPFAFVPWIFMLRSLTLQSKAYKFIGATEAMLPLLLIMVCAFVLYDKTEIELSLVCGTRTSMLFFSKILPLMTYTVLPCMLFAAVFKSSTDGEIDYSLIKKESIYQFIPDDYRIYLTVSIAVTVIFAFSVYSLIRVLMRNCYLTMIAGFGVGAAMSSMTTALGIHDGNLTNCLFDPMINTYFIGNAVPNAYAEKFPELAAMTNIWTYNRLFFLGLSLLIFFITHLILRYEKLHQGITE